MLLAFSPVNAFSCIASLSSYSLLLQTQLNLLADGVPFRQVLQYVTELLNRNVGFLINERFINIPAQVRIQMVIFYHNLF